MKDTLVVVPCFNEQRRLDVDAFARELARLERVSLVLVDDGSRDKTREKLEELRARVGERVVVLALERNGGKAEAVRRGMLAAFERAPAYAGYWDADLATPLADVAGFRALLDRRDDIDLVIGSRVKLLGRSIERRPSRHYPGRVFATAASLALALPIYDTQCGAKLFRVDDDVRAAFERPFESRWAFDVEILARLIASARANGRRPLERRIYEFALDRWTDVDGSKVKARDALRALIDVARIGWRYR